MSLYDKLYSYQKDAFNKAIENDKGIILLPTGCGKSIVESAIIEHDILLNKCFNIYVVLAPRIILTYQLLKETYKHLISSDIECRYMFVHSGGTIDEKDLELIRINCDNDNIIPYSQILSGTSIDLIKDMLYKAQVQNLPIILFSTYNSADRIEIARESFNEISITISDEAQYLVQEKFHDILHVLKSKRFYFFTATTLYTKSDKSRGMNNKEVYGNVLYQLSPREAIDLNRMVRPRLHIVKTKNTRTEEDYLKSMPKVIYESFYNHKAVLKSTVNKAKLKNIDLKELSPKILISVKGSQDILTFLKSEHYIKLRNNNVNVFAISSNEKIGNNINGEKVNRQTFLKQLKIVGEDITKDMIVLHFDILAEGVDIHGFTGILPLRNLSKAKFLQTFGRCARLDNDDRIKVNENKNLQLYKLNKPYAYIIIPNITYSNYEDKEWFENIIKELRSYGFQFSEDVISSSYVHGIIEEEKLDNLNEIRSLFKSRGIEIDDIEFEIEEERVSNLNKVEWLNENI